MKRLFFGHPWHGAWNSVTGKVTSPGGVQFSMRGISPAGGMRGFEYGNTFLVKVPGLPEPVSSAADIAAGQTWTNYAILSGGSKRLYGKALGEFSWLYIDAFKVPWLISVSSHSIATTSSSATLSMSLSIKRFGVFGGVPDARTIDLTATVSGPNFSAGMVLMFEDFNETGSLAAFVIASDVNGFQRWCKAGFEVRLTGSGSSIAAALVGVMGGSDALQQTITSSSTIQAWRWDDDQNPELMYTGPNISTSYPRVFETSKSIYNHLKVLVGLRYKSGARQAMWMQYERSFSGSGSGSLEAGGNHDWSYTSSGSGTTTYKLLAGEVVIDEISLGGSESRSMSGISGVSSKTSTRTISRDGTTWSESGTEGFSDTYCTIGDAGGGMDPLGGYFRKFGSSAVDTIIYAQRYSNAIYGIYLATGDDREWRGVSGKIGANGSIYMTTFSAGWYYASEHPVTGQILRGQSAVGFV